MESFVLHNLRTLSPSHSYAFFLSLLPVTVRLRSTRRPERSVSVTSKRPLADNAVISNAAHELARGLAACVRIRVYTQPNLRYYVVSSACPRCYEPVHFHKRVRSYDATYVAHTETFGHATPAFLNCDLAGALAFCSRQTHVCVIRFPFRYAHLHSVLFEPASDARSSSICLRRRRRA